MKPFCENIAIEFLPAVRSMVTRELIDKHGLTQKQVANLLGLTQPAVSQYLKQARGSKVKVLEKNAQVMEMVYDLTKIIKNQNANIFGVTSKICSICKKMRQANLPDSQCPLEV